MMSAYNKINGETCTQNKWLLTDVLRKEWGFEGLVMSDWGAVYDPVCAIAAGNDLNMPGPVDAKPIADAVKSGELDEAVLNQAVYNILSVYDWLMEQREKAKDIHFSNADVEIIKKKGYDIIVLDTICNATEERQKETRFIAGQSEAMIVIGDRHSSNTQKLYEISKKECANTYYIQTSKDMDYRQIKSINNVGITAGASTPNYIIEEVSKNVRNEL